jgi:hypothetical protein
MKIIRVFTFFLFAFTLADVVSAQVIRSVVITSEPAATVWINDIRYGVTDEEGKLTVKLTGTARSVIRVRALGFKEVTQPILPVAKELTVSLTKTTDEAELAFQDAERLTTIDRPKAAEAYRKALKLRPVLS